MATVLTRIMEEEEQIGIAMADLEKRRTGLFEKLRRAQLMLSRYGSKDSKYYWNRAELLEMNQQIDDITGELEKSELQLDRLSVERREEQKAITPEDAKSQLGAIDSRMAILDLNNRKKHLENEIKVREEAITAGVTSLREGDTEVRTKEQLSINRAELDKAIEELEVVKQTIRDRGSVAPTMGQPQTEAETREERNNR